jgi:hypothetical protein
VGPGHPGCARPGDRPRGGLDGGGRPGGDHREAGLAGRAEPNWDHGHAAGYPVRAAGGGGPGAGARRGNGPGQRGRHGHAGWPDGPRDHDPGGGQGHEDRLRAGSHSAAGHRVGLDLAGRDRGQTADDPGAVGRGHHAGRGGRGPWASGPPRAWAAAGAPGGGGRPGGGHVVQAHPVGGHRGGDPLEAGRHPAARGGARREAGRPRGVDRRGGCRGAGHRGSWAAAVRCAARSSPARQNGDWRRRVLGRAPGRRPGAARYARRPLGGAGYG